IRKPVCGKKRTSAIASAAFGGGTSLTKMAATTATRATRRIGVFGTWCLRRDGEAAEPWHSACQLARAAGVVLPRRVRHLTGGREHRQRGGRHDRRFWPLALLGTAGHCYSPADAGTAASWCTLPRGNLRTTSRKPAAEQTIGMAYASRRTSASRIRACSRKAGSSAVRATGSSTWLTRASTSDV